MACPEGASPPFTNSSNLALVQYSVRAASRDDAAAIALIQVRGWRETYSGLVSQRLLDSLDEHRISKRWAHIITIGELIVLVATDSGDAVVGFASGGLPIDPVVGFDAELHKLYVLKTIHGCGVGRSLLKAMAAQLKAQGFNSMIAHVHPGTGACGFSLHMGAELIHEIPIFIDGEEYEDAAYGWRDLGALLPESTTASP